MWLHSGPTYVRLANEPDTTFLLEGDTVPRTLGDVVAVVLSIWPEGI
jgi:hypothetical protein